MSGARGPAGARTTKAQVISPSEAAGLSGNGRSDFVLGLIFNTAIELEQHSYGDSKTDFGRVAQWIAYRFPKPVVPGSTPGTA